MIEGSRLTNPFTSLGKEFLKDMKSIVQKILIAKGVDNDASILNSIEFTTESSRDSLFMYTLSYYRAISTGRKPRMNKIPIDVLISWIKKKNIKSPKYSTNQLAFVFQRSIYKAGIQGKNFIQIVETVVLDTVETNLADELEKYIADSFYAAFQVVK